MVTGSDDDYDNDDDDHGVRETLDPLLEVIYTKLKENRPGTNGVIEKLVKLVSLFVERKQGKLIKDTNRVMEVIEMDAVEASAQYELMDLCEVIMKTESLVWSQAQKEAVADRILSSMRISLQKKLDFISLFFDLPCVFDSLMLKPYLSLIQARRDIKERANQPSIVLNYGTLNTPCYQIG